MHVPNDYSKKLIQRVRAGHEEAAAELFDRYVVRLIQLVQRRISAKLNSRFEADDVVQSTFRSFFIRVRNDQFVFERSGDLWRLLATIAMAKLHKKANFHGASKRDYRRQLPELLPESMQKETPSPEEEVAMLDLVSQVMASCSDRERSILEFRMQGESIAAIARRLKRSERTVRRILNTIQDRLEAELFGT